MKIHLRQIPDEGLHLEGEEDCPIPEMEKDGVKSLGPLHYSLDVGVSDGSLWANGRISQPVELTCVSCLERFTHAIEVPNFAIVTETTGPETIDLTPFLREDILLNLPAYPHCDRDGARVCKGAQTKEKSTQTDEARKPDWSALDKLDLGKS